METVGTVNFEDLFDFSPEPLDSNLEDSDDKLDLSQVTSDQFSHLINQSAPVESASNRSQGTGSQLSSPLTGNFGLVFFDGRKIFNGKIFDRALRHLPSRIISFVQKQTRSEA